MPATAGRCRMPANNRVHSSAALQTHGIWQSAIGYDPYAPDEKKAGEDGDDNAYDSFQGLLQLAKLTGSGADTTRGSCKKCHRVGHLTFQCRNFLTAKEDVNVPSDFAGGLAGLKRPGMEAAEESDVSLSEEDSDGELAEAARARGFIPSKRRDGGEEKEGKRKSSSKKDKSKSKKRKSSKKSKRKSKRSDSSDDSLSDDSLSDSDDDDSSSDDDRRRRRKGKKDKKRSSKSKKSSRKHRRRRDESDESDDSESSGSESERSSDDSDSSDGARRKRKRKDRDGKKKRRKDRD